jgi:hypothetical protein
VADHPLGVGSRHFQGWAFYVQMDRICKHWRRFPDGSSESIVERIQNVLLLSKRKRVIIPVGNLKVDLP